MKVWLLLSQPPGCLCNRTSFPTWRVLGTLAGGPGRFPLDLGPYQPKSDSRLFRPGILSLVVLGTGGRARNLPVLYLRDCPCEASPKAISGSASYLQVCLAFHSDPHLIPTLFSGFRFGPPPDFTQVSAWTRIDHLASGLPHATAALFRLGFPTAPGLLSLNLAAYGNSQAHSTKGTPSPGRPGSDRL